MADIRWTEMALQDLDDIGAYIAVDSPRSAENVVRRIVESVGALTYHPEMGRPGRIADTRELVIVGTAYIVAYRVKAHIDILTVYHGFRKWPDSLA